MKDEHKNNDQIKYDEIVAENVSSSNLAQTNHRSSYKAKLHQCNSRKVQDPSKNDSASTPETN